MTIASTLLVGAFLAMPPAPAPATRPSVTYEELFGMKERAERVRVFNEIAPDNQAAIVRTHLSRWLAHNRARLSAEQVAVLEEARQMISADLYQAPKEPANQKKVEELGARARALLSPADVASSLMLQGDLIPEEPQQPPSVSAPAPAPSR